ncbi:MAG: GH36-type glycosyl hydrolase domain-containing protein, partial [Spirochaetota bacterium]
MQCGHFDDERREYVITTPKTPVKWINYVGSLRFGGFVDHTGGGVICKGDPALNRITKYIPQMPASDFKAETMYLRLSEPEGYRVFSPYYVPTLDPYDRYECRVGLQYSTFLSEFYGIRTEIRVFVPAGGDRVLRDVVVTNLRETPVEIDAIPVVEYTHFDALKQLTNADWVPQTMQSRLAHERDGRKVVVQFAFMRRETHLNYFTSSHPVSSFETDRARFLGDFEYGTWAHPLALDRAELGDYEANRGDNICALMHHLGRVEPGASVRFVTQLGQEASVEAALPGIETYRSLENVDAAFHDLARFWDDYLATFQVETPSASLNSMLNVHNPRQCYMTKNWSRDLSLYQ